MAVGTGILVSALEKIAARDIKVVVVVRDLVIVIRVALVYRTSNI